MSEVDKLRNRVRMLVEHMTDNGDRCQKSNTTRRALASGRISFSSFARLAETMGYEVVLQVRRKP